MRVTQGEALSHRFQWQRSEVGNRTHDPDKDRGRESPAGQAGGAGHACPPWGAGSMRVATQDRREAAPWEAGDRGLGGQSLRGHEVTSSSLSV